MPQQPSQGRPEEGTRPRASEPVTVLNHSLHLRSIDLGAVAQAGQEVDASTPRKVLQIPAGSRNELRTEIIPGQVEVTAEEWEAIGKHPTARWLVRPKDGRSPVLTRMGF